MNIYDLKKMSPEDRKDFLESHSTEVKEQTYMKPLSDVELQMKHHEFAQSAMQRGVLEDELKEYKKEHKARMEPLLSQFSDSLSAIKNKAVQVTAPTYTIQDFENQAMHYIADDGTVVLSRPMRPEERQMHIAHQIQQAN